MIVQHLPSVTKPVCFPNREHNSGQSQEHMGTALCRSCTAMSSALSPSPSSWDVQGGPWCTGVFRVQLSTSPRVGAVGDCKYCGPTATQRAAGTWGGQSVTRLIHGQDLRLSRQIAILPALLHPLCPGSQTHSSSHRAQPVCTAE